MGITPSKLKKKAKEINLIIPGITRVPVKTKVVFTPNLTISLSFGSLIFHEMNPSGGSFRLSVTSPSNPSLRIM